MTRPVKCVAGDPDHTAWDGILLEDDRVELRPGIAEILHALGERGVPQSAGVGA
jgi:hypothetical protein